MQGIQLLPHEYVINNPKQALETYQNWKRIWMIAKVITAVACLVIGVYTVHTLTDLAFFCFCLLFPCQILDAIHQRVKTYATRALVANDILERTHEFKDSNVKARLTELGLSNKQIESLNHVHPGSAKGLLARFDLMTDYRSFLDKNEKKTTTSTLEKSATMKLQEAFIVKIMTNPYEDKNPSDYIKLEKIGSLYKAASGKQYSIDNVLATPVLQLAEDIFCVPKKGFFS